MTIAWINKTAYPSSASSSSLFGFLTGENLLGDQAGILPDRGLDLVGDIRVRFQERLGVLAALAMRWPS